MINIKFLPRDLNARKSRKGPAALSDAEQQAEPKCTIFHPPYMETEVGGHPSLPEDTM